MKKDICFSKFQLQETPTLTISFFEKRDLEWYSRLVKSQFLICAFFIQYFSVRVELYVIGVISKYSADSVLSNRQSNFA